jgi:hypothetical protein
MRVPARWEHQDEQMPDALGYIFDGLENALAESYTDDQWQFIAERLAEHVQNGLK